MKNLLLILFALGSFSVNAQQQTKEQTIAYINNQLNQFNDLETYTSTKDFKTIIKSAKFSIDTGNIVVFNITREMTYGKKNISVSKLSFNPADIVGIALISDQPNKAGMGYFSVMLNDNGVKAESTLNGVKGNINVDSSFTVDFSQKDKKLFNQLKKAFLTLRDLYK